MAAGDLRLFFDTNILIDVLAKREPFLANAAHLWAAVEQREVRGIVSATSFTTIFYIVQKFASRQRAAEAVNLLARIFEIAAVDSAVVQHAVAAASVDFEDAIQVASAMQTGATHIVTRDATGFRSSPIPVVSADTAVDLLQR